MYSTFPAWNKSAAASILYVKYGFGLPLTSLEEVPSTSAALRGGTEAVSV